MKNILKVVGTLGMVSTPIISVISCGNEKEPDLFIFTGKPENIKEFREIAKLFEKEYKEKVGDELKVQISAVGNGVDTNQNLTTLMQRRKGKPDVITSFGIADIKKFVDGDQIKSLDLSSDQYKWAKPSGITSTNTLKTLTENLSLQAKGKGKVFGLPMAYESVGAVTRVDLLGKIYKSNLDETTKLTIGGKSIENLIEKTDSDVDAGKKILQAIFDTGWTYNEFKALGDFFKGNGKYVFATGGRANDDNWVSGFHTIPNIFSTRNEDWNAFANSYETLYSDKLYDQGKSAFDSEAKLNPFQLIASKNNTLDSKQVKDVIINYFDSIYGEDMYRDSENEPAAISMETSFKAFGDEKALFIHSSVGMFGWVLGQINDEDNPNKLDINNLAPIPLPLDTNSGNSKYKDIPLGNGVLWHFVDKGNNEKEELANQFIRFAMTGVAEIKKGDETIKIENAEAPKLFFNSDSSKLVNPYLDTLGATGDNLTSKIISAELKGHDWKIQSPSTTSALTDEVTIWTNGGNGDFGDNFGEAVLSKNVVGKKYTETSINWDNEFNKWKNRLNANSKS